MLALLLLITFLQQLNFELQFIHAFIQLKVLTSEINTVCSVLVIVLQ